MRILEIVNEAGETIGQAPREEIHAKGLLHKEINVWFYTPEGNIIFQHRAEDKDTYPNLYDASVGGHVEIGQTYDEAAIQEIREEAGIEVNPENLHFISTVIIKSYDEVTGMTNHPRRNVYAYKFEGSVSDLKIEEGKALGFVVYPIEELFSLSESEKNKFIPTLLDDEGLKVFRAIQALI